ncbi:MAG: YihY/virulence factor BrkB family protein [Candidatus Binatia bacterium]
MLHLQSMHKETPTNTPLPEWQDAQADISGTSTISFRQFRRLQRAVPLFARALRERWNTDLIGVRAMALTYATLLSLVPFLAVSFAVLKAFEVHNQIEPFLRQFLAPLGPQGDELTQRVLESVGNLRVGVLGAVGTAGLFYTVITLISRIEESLNHIWRARKPRQWAQRFSNYLSVVLVGPVLVFAAFAVIASLQSHRVVQNILAIQPFGTIVLIAIRVLPFLFLCGAFAFLYKFLPHTYVRVRPALIGGLVAALLWQIAGAIFATFVAGSAQYAAVYSSFAVLILFLIWLYVGWLVILIGGEVAYFCQHPTIALTPRLGAANLQHREHVALLTLTAITTNYLNGRPPERPEALASRLGLPLLQLRQLLQQFVEAGILLRSEEPVGIALARPPEQITASHILAVVHGRPLAADTVQTSPTDRFVVLLESRDRAVKQALAGVTLRSLAEPAATEPATTVEES